MALAIGPFAMLRASVLAAGLFAILPAAHAAPVGPYDRYLPLIQDGAGWTSRITLVNLGKTAVPLQVTFLTAAGFSKPWSLTLTVSSGQVRGSVVEAILPAGGVLRIETSGSASALTRGYAVVDAANDHPLGGRADLIRGGATPPAEVLTVPLSPELEMRSVMPLQLAEPDSQVELIFVSGTSTATIDLTFRDESGRLVRVENIPFEGDSQIFINPLERWPDLRGFRGTVEWVVTFPNAGLYEFQVLAGLALERHASGRERTMTGMTLTGDLGRANPH